MAKKSTTTTRTTTDTSTPATSADGVVKGKGKPKPKAAGKSRTSAARKSKATPRRRADTADKSGQGEAAGAAPDPGETRSKKLAQDSSSGGQAKQIAAASALKGYDKAAARDAGAGGTLSESQLRRIKSGLSRKDLNRYRQLLHRRRADILGDVASLELDAQNGSSGGISYEHMADAGSDNFEQEFTLGLVESERKLLVQINDALLRMRKGIYGVCLERGVPIGTTRLDAKPWAKWCIEVVREKEKLGLR